MLVSVKGKLEDDVKGSYKSKEGKTMPTRRLAIYQKAVGKFQGGLATVDVDMDADLPFIVGDDVEVECDVRAYSDFLRARAI